MKVGLVSVDSLIPNVALMKLSAWHREAGDETFRYEPLLSPAPDRIYASKTFSFTPDFAYYPDCEIVRGGTGYDLEARIPAEAERVYPDYELFGCDFALGRLTRGCVRRCPWCVVPRMDGNRVRQVAELEDFWRGQSRIRLLDDNLTALPDLFVETCDRLAAARVEVKFDALDVRLLTRPMARSLARVRRWGRVHFAFDHPNAERHVREGVAVLRAGGFPLHEAMFYVLVGFNTTHEQDLHRLAVLDELGVDAFVMPFDKHDPYQKRITRWRNRHLHRVCAFEDYDVNAKGSRRGSTPLELEGVGGE